MNVEYNHSFSNLTKFVQVYICSYLTPSEILNLALTCKSNSSILQEKGILKVLSEYFSPLKAVHNPTEDQESPENRWKRVFAIYTEVIDLIFDLLSKCGNNNLQKKHFWAAVGHEGRKRSNDQDIQKAGIKLPLDVYIIYRISSGPKSFEELNKKFIKKGFDFGNIFGGHLYYDKLYTWVHSPFIQVGKKYKDITIFPFLFSKIKQGVICVDVNNDLGLGVGTLFSVVNQRLEGDKTWAKVFIYKKSLTELLKHVNQHEYDPERKYIDLLNTTTNAKGDVTTRGVRVRANCIYSAWDQSYGDNELFAYQIRYSDNGTSEDVHYKLTTRHWVITDRGEKRNVDGPGVIGYYPEVYPKCKDFYYESCSPQYDFEGSIGGKFKFKDIESGEVIDVQAPLLKFEFPKGSALLDYLDKEHIVVKKNRLDE